MTTFHCKKKIRSTKIKGENGYDQIPTFLICLDNTIENIDINTSRITISIGHTIHKLKSLKACVLNWRDVLPKMRDLETIMLYDFCSPQELRVGTIVLDLTKKSRMELGEYNSPSNTVVNTKIKVVGIGYNTVPILDLNIPSLEEIIIESSFFIGLNHLSLLSRNIKNVKSISYIDSIMFFDISNDDSLVDYLMNIKKISFVRCSISGLLYLMSCITSKSSRLKQKTSLSITIKECKINTRKSTVIKDDKKNKEDNKIQINLEICGTIENFKKIFPELLEKSKSITMDELTYLSSDIDDIIDTLDDTNKHKKVIVV